MHSIVLSRREADSSHPVPSLWYRQKFVGGRTLPCRRNSGRPVFPAESEEPYPADLFLGFLVLSVAGYISPARNCSRSAPPRLPPRQPRRRQPRHHGAGGATATCTAPACQRSPPRPVHGARSRRRRRRPVLRQPRATARLVDLHRRLRARGGTSKATVVKPCNCLSAMLPGRHSSSC